MRNKIWPLSTNCLSVLEYFVGFALQGLKSLPKLQRLTVAVLLIGKIWDNKMREGDTLFFLVYLKQKWKYAEKNTSKKNIS